MSELLNWLVPALTTVILLGVVVLQVCMVVSGKRHDRTMKRLRDELQAIIDAREVRNE